MEIVKEEKETPSFANLEAVKKPKKTVYDPNKQYTWKPDAEFTLNGESFGAILNLCRSILSTREAQTVLLADRANEYIEELFKVSVENGTCIEATPNVQK